MNKMHFTKKELTAILNIANGMANIDGKTDAVESEVIYLQMKALGVEHEELLELTKSALLNMTPREAACILTEMTPSQKQYVQAILVVIMASDGEIHERELMMLRVLTMTCDLPPINMNDIKHAFETFKNTKP